jgi:four helix bundle protein
MITLHGLKVYQKALALATDAEEISASWGRRHAIVDHFRRLGLFHALVCRTARSERPVGSIVAGEDRSATSVVLNVPEGNERYSELDHRRFLELAAASGVKTAAYLDLYQQKALPVRVETTQAMEYLSRIVAMLSQF